MLAHVPSFRRNPRGSPDFLAYPVPKACMHVLGTRVRRRLGVPRSAPSPKAALALGCSLTPGLRISFGRVTCMARAASVPGLWALGFLLLACVCGWLRVAVGRGFCLPLLVVAGVLGGCVWAQFVVLSLFCRLFVVFLVGLWCRPAFGTCVVSCAFPWPPAVSGSGVRCGRACWARVSAVPRPSWLGCRGVSLALFCFFFVFVFFSIAGCPCPGPCGLSPRILSFGLGCWLFFFLLVSVPLFPVGRCSWLGVAGFGWVVPLCLFGGHVFGALWAVFARPPPPPPPSLFFFWAGGGRPGCSSLCLPSAGACSVAGVWCGWSLGTPGGGSCVLLPATPGWVSLPVVLGGPRHSWLGSAGGVAVWCVVCGGGVLAGSWLVCGVAGPSPLLAEVPVCYSPPLLAAFRCRWWWAVPATPGWRPLAAVVCGVWCVAAVCWWGCGWCLVWLVPRLSWRWFLCATPRHSWLGFAAGGGGRSPPLLAGVRLRRWCVVCGVWCVVCGGGVLVGLWLVCGGVGPSPLLAEVPVCYSPPLLAGFRCRWWWAVPATPGWGRWRRCCVVCGVWSVAVVCWWGCGWCVVWLVPRHSWRWFLLCPTPRHSWLGFAAGGGGRSPPLLAGVRLRGWWLVCGVWCVVCGGGVLLGLWLVCGVVGPSPLLAVVPPVSYSPPLLAGFRCRWWWAVPATPGWGPLAAVVVGVWCVVCGGGVLLGLWLVCGVVCPSPLLAEVPVCYSPPLLAGFRCRWWWAVPATPGWGPLAAVVCGVWCVGGVPRHSWRRFLCATPRHSWLGFAAAGGERSPPLLAGVRWRRWCVVCVRVRALLGRVGRAGLPGAFWCASPFPLAALSFCFAWPPPGWGCPSLFRCCCRSSLVFFSFSASRCLALRALAPRLCPPLGRWLLFGGCSPAPLPFCVSRFSSLLLGALVFFVFFSLLLLPVCAPVVSGFLWFPAPGALGLGAVRCLLCWPSASRLSVRLSFFRAFRLVVGCSRVAAAPPPLLLHGFRSCRSVLCAVLCCASLAAVLRRAAARCVARCCAVVCCVALVWCRCLLRRALWRCPSPCALRRCVLRCSPALCALCCVCFVVARWCVLLFAASPCAVCVSGCCAVRSLCSPFCAVLCFAVLVRPRCAVRVVRAVAGAWCCGALLCVVLVPVVCRGALLGLVARGCLLVACFGVGVPVWPCGLLPCG